jgi:DNA processing protein
MGCNQLIKDGAKLVERFEDILEEFEFMEGHIRDYDMTTTPVIETIGTSRKETQQPTINLSANEQKVVDSLKTGVATIDQIAMKTELPVGKLLGLLMQLEMKKIVNQEPGRKFKLH